MNMYNTDDNSNTIIYYTAYIRRCGDLSNQVLATCRTGCLRYVSCQRSPWGDSFSNEILWQIRLVLCLGILYVQRMSFEKEFPSGGSQAGNISQSSCLNLLLLLLIVLCLLSLLCVCSVCVCVCFVYGLLLILHCLHVMLLLCIVVFVSCCV